MTGAQAVPQRGNSSPVVASDDPHRTQRWHVRSGTKRVLRRVAGLILFVLILQALSLWGPRQWQIPGLGAFVTDVAKLVSAPAFLMAVAETLAAVLIAITIATVIAIVIGVIFGSSRFLEITFGLPLELLRPIPAFAIVPLAVIALGSGLSMEVAVGVFAGWWPLLFNTIYGVRQVDRLARDAARVMGFGQLHVAYRVVVPSLLPFLIAGLRVGLPIVFVVVIGAEYLSAAQRGIGGVLIIATSGGQLSVLWATAAISGVLGILLGGVVALFARWAAPWTRERDA